MFYISAGVDSTTGKALEPVHCLPCQLRFFQGKQPYRIEVNSRCKNVKNKVMLLLWGRCLYSWRLDRIRNY